MPIIKRLRYFALATGAILLGLIIFAAGPKLPTMTDSPEGRQLVLPDALDTALTQNFPGYKIPQLTDFNPEMLKYYYSEVIGVHPAVIWGDFNGDKKQDYALFLITGNTSWGPLIELVIMDGDKKGGFVPYRLNELYSFKDDYLSFMNGRLYKGKYKRDGWHINWDPKKKAYTVLKS